MDNILKLYSSAKRRMIGCILAFVVFAIISFLFIPRDSQFSSIIVSFVSFALFFLFNFREYRVYSVIFQNMQKESLANDDIIRVHLPSRQFPMDFMVLKLVKSVNGEIPQYGLNGSCFYMILLVEKDNVKLKKGRKFYPIEVVINNSMAYYLSGRKIYKNKESVVLTYDYYFDESGAFVITPI